MCERKWRGDWRDEQSISMAMWWVEGTGGKRGREGSRSEHDGTSELFPIVLSLNVPPHPIPSRLYYVTFLSVSFYSMFCSVLLSQLNKKRLANLMR